MKFLFVIAKWAGGVGRYVSETAKALEELGHKVKVISRNDDLRSGFWSSFWNLRNAVKKEEYDVLMAEDWSIALPLLGMKNLLCTFNAVSPNFPANILQKFIYHTLSGKIILVSYHLKKYFPKGRVVEEGVNLDFFKPKKVKKSKKFTVGFAQNTKNESYRFELVKSAVDNMKGVELKTTGGKLTDKEVVDFYNKLDVLISIPDFRAGFNLCWLEAMACEIPAIGNDHGVGEKLPLIKVPEPPEKKHVVQAIKKAKKLRKKNYRKWIKANAFTWKDSAKTMVKTIKKILNKNE